VPNDTLSGLDTGRMKLLTGTNASGKSVYLKQVEFMLRSAHGTLPTVLAGKVVRSVVFVCLSVCFHSLLNQLIFDLDFYMCVWVMGHVPSVF